ncbi:hypothetical protein ABW19_dt0201925 [Dactylella cylindrospora]|nr:hypothetical protein ABW19_dt0201925 [Dactylella cylindrospora]
MLEVENWAVDPESLNVAEAQATTVSSPNPNTEQAEIRPELPPDKLETVGRQDVGVATETAESPRPHLNHSESMIIEHRPYTNANEALQLPKKTNTSAQIETSVRTQHRGSETVSSLASKIQIFASYFIAHKHARYILGIPILLAVLLGQLSNIWASPSNKMKPAGRSEARLNTYLDIPIIAVMGETGAGKSTFIESIGGKDENGASPVVGHSLNSTTKSVIWYIAANSRNKPFYILDTPGFDDSYLSDFEILDALVVELAGMYKVQKALNGVVYLHDVTKVRVGGTSHKSLRTFRKLIGDSSLKNVVLTTTHWTSDPKLPERERELKEGFWRAMIVRGSRTERYDGTKQSGLKIVDSILPNEPFTANVVDQLVNGDRTVEETDAGKVVGDGLSDLWNKVTAEVEALDAELLEMKAKNEARAESQDELEKLSKQNKAHNQELQQREGPANQGWDDELRRHKEQTDKAIRDAESRWQIERIQLISAMAIAEKEKSDIINTMKRLEEAKERLQNKINELQNASPSLPDPALLNITLPDRPSSFGFRPFRFYHKSYFLLDLLALVCWFLETLLLIMVTFVAPRENFRYLKSFTPPWISWIMFSFDFFSSYNFGAMTALFFSAHIVFQVFMVVEGMEASLLLLLLPIMVRHLVSSPY